MKLAISRNGGTGKSTISSLLSHYFSKAGYKVLAIDSDPDSNLASAIGISQEEIKKIIPIFKERLLIKKEQVRTLMSLVKCLKLILLLMIYQIKQRLCMVT